MFIVKNWSQPLYLCKNGYGTAIYVYDNKNNEILIQSINTNLSQENERCKTKSIL